MPGLPRGPIKPHNRERPPIQRLWPRGWRNLKGRELAPRLRDWAEEAEKERGSVSKGMFSASEGSSPLRHLESPWMESQTCGWHIDKSVREEALHWADSCWSQRMVWTSFWCVDSAEARLSPWPSCLLNPMTSRCLDSDRRKDQEASQSCGISH